MEYLKFILLLPAAVLAYQFVRFLTTRQRH